MVFRAVTLLVLAFSMTVNASAEEAKIRVGAIDAVLTRPSDVERPPVALLIAGSGPTDHDGNAHQIKPATLKKLSEQLAARKIAGLRYDKRGAGPWKPEFGRPEDFRFKEFVDDAVALATYLRSSGKFSKVILIGHSEGALVACLAAQRAPIEAVVLLAGASQRQSDLLKVQLKEQLKQGASPADIEPLLTAIDAIMAGRVVDSLPGHPIIPPPAMQPSLASAFNEDPIAAIKAVRTPVLIIGGGRDRQVARLDFDGLAAAAPAAKTLWVENMNHVLVDVGDNADNFAAYNQPERALNIKLIDSVAAFVLGNETR
jgi:alpha-beta hydrolase superfamily lysophospholipase